MPKAAAHGVHTHTGRGLPLRRLPAMDLPFLVLVLTLVGFGLVMLGSASSAVALYRRNDAFAYLRPQLLYAALGIGAMWAASRVDYHIYHKLAWPLLGLSMVLLTAVLFMPEYNGCKRWLVLPGLGTLQPSEIAKFAVVLVFAHIISLNHDRMGSFAVGVLPFALVLGVVAVLMLLEPHLSGTVLILCIGAVLMFVGGTGLRWFVLAGVGGLDLAAMTGAFLGCAHERVPAAVDGFISIAAALCAVRLCPAVRDVLFLSHDSYEVGYRIAAETLGLQPCLRLGMRLGEGSGCPLLFRVLEGACGVMRGMATFGEASIEDSYLDEIRAVDAFTVEGA